MTATHARLIVYILGALVGAFLVAVGAFRGDWSLITAGIGLLGVGSLAGANTQPRDTTEDELRGRHAAE